MTSDDELERARRVERQLLSAVAFSKFRAMRPAVLRRARDWWVVRDHASPSSFCTAIRRLALGACGCGHDELDADCQFFKTEPPGLLVVVEVREPVDFKLEFCFRSTELELVFPSAYVVFR